jgi:hypothetical protein
MNAKKYIYILSLVAISCGEPQPIMDDEISERLSLGFLDSSADDVKEISVSISVMNDGSYDIVFIKRTQAPDNCSDYDCLCEEPTLCSRGEIKDQTYGNVSSDEIDKIEAAMKKPLVNSKKGLNCRHYSTNFYDGLTAPRTEKVCTDGELDALDLDIQHVINELIARARP